MTKLQLTNKILKGATFQKIGAEEIETNFDNISTKRYSELAEENLETLHGLDYENEDGIFFQMDVLNPKNETQIINGWADTDNAISYLTEREFSLKYENSTAKKIQQKVIDIIFNFCQARRMKGDSRLHLNSNSKYELVEEIIEMLVDVEIHEIFLTTPFKTPLRTLIEVKKRLLEEVEKHDLEILIDNDFTDEILISMFDDIKEKYSY